MIAVSTAARSVMSRSARATASTSSPAPRAAATTSWPSWPPAPVTSSLISQLACSPRRRPTSLPRGAFGDRCTVAQRLPPLPVGGIPVDRRGDAAVPVGRRRPAELAVDLRPVEDVATVVSGTVGHDRLQRLRLAEVVEDRVGDLLDAALDTRADVVGLAHATALEDRVDRPAVVDGVDPLPSVRRRGVQRQRLVLERQ